MSSLRSTAAEAERWCRPASRGWPPTRQVPARQVTPAAHVLPPWPAVDTGLRAASPTLSALVRTASAPTRPPLRGNRAPRRANALSLAAGPTSDLVSVGYLGQAEWRPTDAQSGLTLAGMVTRTVSSLQQVFGDARPEHRARGAGARAGPGPWHDARQPRIILQSGPSATEPATGEAAPLEVRQAAAAAGQAGPAEPTGRMTQAPQVLQAKEESNRKRPAQKAGLPDEDGFFVVPGVLGGRSRGRSSQPARSGDPPGPRGTTWPPSPPQAPASRRKKHPRDPYRREKQLQAYSDGPQFERARRRRIRAKKRAKARAKRKRAQAKKRAAAGKRLSRAKRCAGARSGAEQPDTPPRMGDLEGRPAWTCWGERWGRLNKHMHWRCSEQAWVLHTIPLRREPRHSWY